MLLKISSIFLKIVKLTQKTQFMQINKVSINIKYHKVCRKLKYEEVDSFDYN